MLRSENLVDFPVLVQLDSSRIDYSLTQNDGADLRFVDRDGTLLPHEIETWNAAGTSYVWVKVPQIDGSSGTDHIWLYYGNAVAADAQNVAAVWNSGYAAVYHLDDTSQDSTANLNHGTNSGSLDAPGRVADGQWFDGVDDYVDLGSAATVDDLFAGGGTVSAWIRPTGWGEGSYGRILDKTVDHFADGGWGFELYGANQSLRFEQGHTGAAAGRGTHPVAQPNSARGNTSSWSTTTVLSPTIRSFTSTAACKRSPKRPHRAASPTRMPRQVCGWVISRSIRRAPSWETWTKCAWHASCVPPTGLLPNMPP